MAQIERQRSNERRSVGERREQLVDAAIEVLAAEGLTGTTTRAITDQAGLALGAFHYAFESKDALLRAVLDRRAEEMETALTTATRDISSVQEVVDRLAEVAWTIVQGRRDLEIAIYELTLHALRNPELAEVAAGKYDRYVEVVREAISGVVDLPDDHAAEEIARFLVATFDGLMLQDLIHGDPEAARRRMRMMSRAVTPVAQGEHPDLIETRGGNGAG